MTVTKMLDELQFGRTEPIVRVNSVDSGLAEDDIKAVMEAKSLPPTWMIPKVDDPVHIQWVSFFYLLFCTCLLFFSVSNVYLFVVSSRLI